MTGHQHDVETDIVALRRELTRLRGEVEDLREQVYRVDGELGFAMMTCGRLRGRLDREVAAREALESRLLPVDRGQTVGQLPGQSGPSSRSAAWRSGTRSFLTDVET